MGLTNTKPPSENGPSSDQMPRRWPPSPSEMRPYIAAGSTINRDVPDGALRHRPLQTNHEGGNGQTFQKGKDLGTLHNRITARHSAMAKFPPKMLCFFPMCGIVGHVGTKNAVQVISEGLSRLEYRGYDSAGICLKDLNGKLVQYKKDGKTRKSHQNFNRKKAHVPHRHRAHPLGHPRQGDGL